MEKLAMLLLTETAETLTVDSVSNLSKSITEYGIMAVCCAIFLIMALVMFNTILKRFAKQDEITTKSILDAVNMLKDMKDNNVNIAGSFDKHNMVATQEFKNIEAKLKDLSEVLAQYNKGYSELKRELEVAHENQNNMSHKIESLNYNIERLEKAINELDEDVDRIRQK